jgi:isochorismate synthase EntC
MANLTSDFNYKLVCSSQDMRLITMALAGKLKRKDDIKEAADLNIKLLQSQQFILKERSNLITEALTIALENLPIKE